MKVARAVKSGTSVPVQTHELLVKPVSTVMERAGFRQINAKLVQPGIIALGELLESHVDPASMAIKVRKMPNRVARAARSDTFARV